MKMTVIGCGHLGTTHAASMAALGHEVVGVDIDATKVGMLNSGKAWFSEPDLDAMLAENIEAGRLRFTMDFAEAAEFASVHFIGVATPGQEDGTYDLSQLYAAVSALVPHLRGDVVIIGKSTVPPGTASGVQALVDGMLPPGQGHVEVVWNPEFLREGRAVEDTLRPDRIVVGAPTEKAAAVMDEIYRPLTDAGVPLLHTDLVTSELAKGAANAFLAMKISFINSMADICVAVGGDIATLEHSLGLDPRIGSTFLKAGLGYGGACLPKDVRGLGTFADGIGVTNAAALLRLVDKINATRAGQVVACVQEAIGHVAGKRVTVWGGAFKAGTDDVRDSAGLKVAQQLRDLGAEVTVFDPVANGTAAVIFPELNYANSAIMAAAGADAIVVVTAWPEFAATSAVEVGAVMKNRIVVDACQGIDAAAWRTAGYRSVSLTGIQS